MSNVTLNTAAATAITAAVSAVEGAARKMQSSIDTLVASGMRSTDFISPKSKDGGSTSSPEQFEAINAAIVAGFTARGQKLLAAPTKALPEADKAEKRYLQQQIGARRNDFKRGLEKREGAADDRAPNHQKTRSAP
jgi:outer membrane PBP1 activator LpoA protein